MAKNKGTDLWNTPADPKADLAAFSKEEPHLVVTPAEEVRLPSPEELADPNALINLLPEETLKQRFARYVTESNATMSKETTDEVIYYGLVGETGEVAELFKKHLGHGHPLSLPSLRKEIGDVLWYVARVQERYGTKGEHGIEPFLIIGPRSEMLKRLAQQVAGCTEEFMQEAKSMDVTDRCSRIVAYLVGLYREAELSLTPESDSLKDLNKHMEHSLFNILDENKAKLSARFQSGAFSTEESLNRKETDK